MFIKKQLLATAGLFAAVALSVAATLPQQHPEPKLVNIKVFPKNIPYRVLDHAMDVWSASLGVRCNFCHAKNDQTGKLDFASDAKPEKTAAREMYKIMDKINTHYFEAKKDSLGMVMTTGVNCYSCHHGVAHPEIKLPEEHHGPGGPPPGAPGAPPAGGTPPPPPTGGSF